MNKRDKVVYRTRTLEEYNWLMEKLEEAGCIWMSGKKPTASAIFYKYKSNTYIFLEDKELSFGGREEYILFRDKYENIEVSDIMED